MVSEPPWRNRLISSIHTSAAKRGFQKSPLWETFLKRCLFGDRFDQTRMEGRLNQRKKISVFKQQPARVGEARKVGESFEFNLSGNPGLNDWNHGMLYRMIILDYMWRIHSNLFNTDAEGTEPSVRIIEVGNVWFLAFLGPNELSVIESCPYYRDVFKERLDCTNKRWISYYKWVLLICE